ncbi:MAG: polysaccharide biosynthesis C-terminal domain-containing protein, partial [Pyrinomonadaceae bacterium]
VSQVIQFILQGLQRFDRYLIIVNFSGLLLSIGNVILVLNGQNVLALIIWNCLLVGTTGFVFVLTSRRLLPEFRLRLSIPGDVWRTVLTYAGSIIAYQSFGNALLLFERAWIVRNFGTDSLTLYALPMLLCFYFHGLIHNLVIVLFPVVNELLNEKEKLLRMYRTATKIIFAITVFFCLSTVITGRTVLDVWLGYGFSDRTYVLLVIHAVTFSILAITIIPWQITESFGKAKANAIMGGTWFVIAVPLMVVFSQTWQTEGVAIARLAGVVVFLGLVVYAENWLLGLSSRRFWPKVIVATGGAAVAASVVEMLIMSVGGNHWAALIVAGTLGAAAFAAGLHLMGFIEEDEWTVLRNLTPALKRTAAND